MAPDEANEDRTTPLLSAIKYGHREIAERLLDAGANPAHEDDLEETPLSTAQYHERPEIVRLLQARLGKRTAKAKPAAKAKAKPARRSKPTSKSKRAPKAKKRSAR